MTDAELETIAVTIRHQAIAAEPWPLKQREAVKLLRSIEIATLREAREIVEKAVAYYQADDFVRSVALEKLDKHILALELK